MKKQLLFVALLGAGIMNIEAREFSAAAKARAQRAMVKLNSGLCKAQKKAGKMGYRIFLKAVGKNIQKYANMLIKPKSGQTAIESITTLVNKLNDIPVIGDILEVTLDELGLEPSDFAEVAIETALEKAGLSSEEDDAEEVAANPNFIKDAFVRVLTPKSCPKK